MGDPFGCQLLWATDQTPSELAALDQGLAELADRPLTELPGIEVEGRSPMHRKAVIGSTYVYFMVYESQGVFDLIDLGDFDG